MLTPREQETLQREYYSRTAGSYDSAHLLDPEHRFALSILSGAIEYLDIQSILDVGSGTGRALEHLSTTHPGIDLLGIEPVTELREVGHKKGIPASQLVDGDAMSLDLPDGAFDIVVEFGVLHHVPDPQKAISEMLRTAKKAVFISDCNTYGQGSARARAVKQVLRSVRCWKAVNRIKTRGRGYTISSGDGLAYSYSVFDDLPLLELACSSVHTMNTLGSSSNHLRNSPHLCVLGIK